MAVSSRLFHNLAACAVLLTAISAFTAANAQTSADFSAGGSVIMGMDNDPCDSSKAGAIRYNATENEAQYCDGSQWTHLGADPCADDMTAECLLDATRDASDPEFVASNIASGVNILGVTGTLTGGGGTPCVDDDETECLLEFAPAVCPDPTAGMTADRVESGPANFGNSLEPATEPATFHMQVTLPAANPDGVILESGRGTRGLAIWVDNTNTLYFGVGDGGAVTDNNAVVISTDISAFLGQTIDIVAAVNDAPGQAALYVNDCWVTSGETTGGGNLESNEWADDRRAAYGQVDQQVRTGAVTTSFNGTLASDMTMYSGELPSNFPARNGTPFSRPNDPDLIATNIADGVNILGVVGTFGGSGFAQCAGPPGDCTRVGDVCSDGTVFAGCHPHPTLSGQRLFLHPNNQSTLSDWHRGSNQTNSGIDGDLVAAARYDGRANQAVIEATRPVTATSYDAFYLCKQLNDTSSMGHTDWYLPSQVELYYLFSVQDDINAGPSEDFFTFGVYWTSTESTTSQAWRQSMSGGLQETAAKGNSFDVRCLRRE